MRQGGDDAEVSGKKEEKRAHVYKDESRNLSWHLPIQMRLTFNNKL